MSRTVSLVSLGAVLVALLLSSGKAEARRGGSRLNESASFTVAPEFASDVAEAKLRIRRRAKRQEISFKLHTVSSLGGLEVRMDDGSGKTSVVGGMTERRTGRYSWWVRTRRGTPLPFGVADVAELSGRAMEIVTEAGSLVADGTFPVISGAAAPTGNRARADSSLSVTSDLGDGTRAEVRVRRRGSSRSEFRVKVERAPAGLSLEAYIGDESATMEVFGSLRESSNGSKAEYQLKLRTEHGDALPAAAGSVGELAGLHLEVRDAEGDVLASGTVPGVGLLEDDESDDSNGGTDNEDDTAGGDDDSDDNESDDEDDESGDDESDDDDSDDDESDDDESDDDESDDDESDDDESDDDESDDDESDDDESDDGTENDGRSDGAAG